MVQEIIIRNVQKPREQNVSHDIEWLCDSLGFMTGRDTERIMSQLIRQLLQEVGNDGSASTVELADRLGIAPQRVNYHLRGLTDSGFIYRERKLIFLREGSVKAAIEELRQDANRIFDRLSVIGEEIDTAVGLKSR